MNVVEISQDRNKILLTFETEEEARLIAPALHSILFKLSEKTTEAAGKENFIKIMFGGLIGDLVIKDIGLNEAFEISKKRAIYVKDFFNI